MKISVLTICFNAAGTIRRTIESFLEQDYRNREMIVVDGASTDGTAEMAHRYERDGVRVVSEPDRGMYDALNKGLALYGGGAFGALNADDAYHDRAALSRIAEGLTRADIVHGDLDFVADHVGRRVVRRWRAVDRPGGGFRTGWMPAHPTFYVRRAVAERVGRFDLGLGMAADYDWMLRAVELHGFTIARVDGVLVDMQQGGMSTSGLRAHLAHNIDALRSRRKWLDAGLVDYAAIAKPARKLRQFLLPAGARADG